MIGSPWLEAVRSDLHIALIGGRLDRITIPGPARITGVAQIKIRGAHRHCAEWMWRIPRGKPATASRIGGTGRGGEEARIYAGANGHTLEPLPSPILQGLVRITKLNV